MRLKFKKSKIWWLFFSLFFGFGFLIQMNAQTNLQKIIQGKVVDSQGTPLVGVTIMVKGTSIGTVTNVDGNFTISNVPMDATLVISYVGMKTQEIPVSNRDIINVILEEESVSLEEVVAVGYGTQKKESLTGAISSIQSKEITTTVHSSLAQELQGKIAGLVIRQNTGGPGDFDHSINLRGFGSPLYVIDGIIRPYGPDFQKIPPEDIESISVLKDASAAIYGINAANGVVLITTKKGTKGKPKIQINSVVGFQSPTDMPEMANAAQYLEMRNDANINIGLAPIISKDELLKYRQGLPGYESTNWFDYLLKKNALQQQHNISVQGGSDAAVYFLSFGYVDDEGLFKSNDWNYNKYNFRTNITANLTKNLVADVNIFGRYDERNQPGGHMFSVLETFKGCVLSLPTEPVYANNNPDYPNNPLPTSQNPVVLMDKDKVGYTKNIGKLFQSSFSLTYNVPFVKNLKIKGLAAYDNTNNLDKFLLKTYKLYTYDAATNNYLSQTFLSPSQISNDNWDDNTLDLQLQLFYNTTIANNHHLNATFVYEQIKQWARYTWLRRDYTFFTLDQIRSASLSNQQTDGYETESARMSYLGRINYDYKGKYLLELAGRYDGSYRYHPDKRWGFFPTISGGWRISEEEFLKNVDFLSNLKIRASYGIIGQDVGDPFQYVEAFSTTGGGGYSFEGDTYITGAASPTVVNKNLTWATSKITDVGIDLGLFKNRLNMGFDIYQRDRSGLLATRYVTLPNTFGGTLPQENLNSDRVRGFDFSIGYNDMVGDFKYNVQVNFNTSRTMDRHIEEAPFGNSWLKYRNGRSNRWNDILWGYVLDGQFQNQEEIVYAPIQSGSLGNIKELPGDYKFKDVNGDGVVNANDMQPIFYNGNPKMQYGITLGAEWKGFDFNALLQGSGKYTVRLQEGYAMYFWGGGNVPAFFYDRWHLSDQYNPQNSEWISGEWPSPRMAWDFGNLMYADHSIWRRDASYLRIKSVELGYTFANKALKKGGINSMRIYANGHNIFTFAGKYVKPFDPEKIEGAFAVGYNYPVLKSYNFGINLTF